jgi:hypothetical protein
VRLDSVEVRGSQLVSRCYLLGGELRQGMLQLHQHPHELPDALQVIVRHWCSSRRRGAQSESAEAVVAVTAEVAAKATTAATAATAAIAAAMRQRQRQQQRMAASTMSAAALIACIAIATQALQQQHLLQQRRSLQRLQYRSSEEVPGASEASTHGSRRCHGTRVRVVPANPNRAASH